MAIDVLIVAKHDWSNVGYSFQKALEAVGVRAKAIKAFPHSFEYPEQAEVITDVSSVKGLFDEAKAILWMHSRADFRPPGFDYSKKFNVVFHGGSPYRRNPAGVNSVFNPFCRATIIQTGNLLDLGAVNEHWIMPPVDVDVLPTRKMLNHPPTIGHYPRLPELKGTETINQVVYGLLNDPKYDGDFDYLHDVEPIDWDTNIKRMANCDIYVESQMYVDQAGNPVMEFGVTAMEAAGLGCAVATVFRSKGRYEDTFGPCPIIACNSQDELRSELGHLLRGHKNKLVSLRRKTRAWVEDYHSYPATGKQLLTVFDPAF